MDRRQIHGNVSMDTTFALTIQWAHTVQLAVIWCEALMHMHLCIYKYTCFLLPIILQRLVCEVFLGNGEHSHQGELPINGQLSLSLVYAHYLRRDLTKSFSLVVSHNVLLRGAIPRIVLSAYCRVSSSL